MSECPTCGQPLPPFQKGQKVVLTSFEVPIKGIVTEVRRDTDCASGWSVSIMYGQDDKGQLRTVKDYDAGHFEPVEY